MAPTENALSQIRVLVIEDSEDDAELSRLELKRAGFEVELRRVERSNDIRDALSDGAWDIVIADYNVPGLDLRQELALIRETYKDLPVVIVSGAIGEETAVELLKAGAQDYVPKGRMARLGEVIRRELREKEIRRARARAEAALREGEERLSTVLENLPVGVVIADATGEISHFNRTAKDIWGGSLYVKPSQYGLYEAWRPDTGERISDDEWAITRAIREAKAVPAERLRIRSFDGITKTIVVAATPILDAQGEQKGAVAVIQDITEQARAEEYERFLAQEAYFLSLSLDFETTLRTVADSAVPRFADWCFIVLSSPDGALEKVAIRGPSGAEEIASRIFARYEIAPTASRGINRVLKTGEPEFFPVFSDDHLREVAPLESSRKLLSEAGLRSYLVVPLKASHRIIGVISFGISESDRRFDLQDLKVAEELARRASAAIENSLLYRDAQQAIRIREEILAVVSHDLKNPLAAVKLNAAMIKRELGGEAAEAPVSEHLKRIHGAVDRMVQMIDDLVSMGRIEGGRLKPSVRPESAEQVALAAVEMLRPLARVRNIAIAFETKGSLPEICCDKNLLFQVFENLIGNALKFTPDRGSVVVRCEIHEEGVCYSVSDSGPGIGPEDLPYVFERYWQARKHRKEGAGLGLYIAKGIVEAHGGRIWAESKPGSGTRFVFVIPVAGSQCASRAAGDESAA